MRKSYKVRFEGGNRFELSGILDLPDASIDFFALFAHCFTCNKDLKAIVRISQNLAKQGIGVLRFDFTGLGESKGSFSEQNFQSNLRDINSAFQFLRNEHQSPQLFIGHSLGGAAVLAAKKNFPNVKAVSTIASPSDTFHLAALLKKMNPDIVSKGEGQVSIGGREYQIRRQLIEDLEAYDLKTDIQNLQTPLLVFHSPTDATLGMRYARQMIEYAGNSASLISLAGADHLLTSDARDVEFVANMIAIWSKRIISST